MTATADRELVFAGPGRAGQARARARSQAAGAGRVVPAPDRVDRPRAECIPRHAGRTGAGRSRRTHRRAARAPARGRPDRDQGRYAHRRPSASRAVPAPTGRPRAPTASWSRRLRAAGAIPIGITNVPELMIFPWTASAANGVTRNPWNLERTPGGSSGGSAAAVAAGMVPLRHRLGRRRLHPHPRRLLRAGRDEADSRPRLLAAGARGLAGVEHVRCARAHGRRQRAAARRHPRRAARRISTRRRRSPGAMSRPPPSHRVGCGLRPRAGCRPASIARAVRRPAGARGSGPASCSANSGTRWWSGILPTGCRGIEFTQMWLRGIYEESRHVPDHAQLERSTRQLVAAGRRLVPDRPTREATGRAGRPDRAGARAVAGGRRAADARAGHHSDRGRGRLRKVCSARHGQGIALHAVTARCST